MQNNIGVYIDLCQNISPIFVGIVETDANKFQPKVIFTGCNHQTIITRKRINLVQT